MPRHGRYFLKGQPLHLIQRGNNREPTFFHDEDYRLYLRWLGEAAQEYGARIDAYVLMTNHVHLLVTPEAEDSVPRTMQSLGRRYVRHVNSAYGRTGTLWEGRYRAAPIDSDEYFFSCCVYIELNPVRAKMVSHPRHYPWSSYRAHAEGKEDALLGEPALFARLGRTRAARQEAYRELFKRPLDDGFVEALRNATNGGWAFGNDMFRRQIAKALKRRVSPLARGRPPKNSGSRSQLNLL
jgi:putative transposase